MEFNEVIDILNETAEVIYEEYLKAGKNESPRLYDRFLAVSNAVDLLNDQAQKIGELEDQQAENERLKEEKQRAIRDIDLHIDDCRKELHSTFSKEKGYQLGIKRGLIIAKEILQGTRNHG